ncbi:LysM domain-containing protein [Cordyceps javanica]|uniref:LysM domain-containing protein n=1 Tax=Cordyceps javanica TaxID=43265 RepID=A0A545UWU5_9HYPO|nr:LysM domain-containing protein [Cordyceps javanica]TQW04717.1 LysM domain-containing protein [Cordyceps javanica]
MVSTKLLASETLAFLAFGLSSVVYSAPAAQPDHSVTTQSATKTTATAATLPSDLTTTHEGASHFPTAKSPAWITFEDSEVTGEEAKKDLEHIAGLLGITAEQMTRLKFGSTDPELSGPDNGSSPAGANIALPAGIEIELPGESNSDLGISAVHPIKFSPGDTEDVDIFKKTRYEQDTEKRMRKTQDKKKVLVGLVNGTPYRWQLMGVSGGYMDSLFVQKLPRIIEPGLSVTVHADTQRELTYAEVRYRLLGTTEEMWFVLKISTGYPHQVTVEYGGALETVGRGDEGSRGSVVDLGVDRGVSIPTFALAGVEGRFYANDAPPNWMSSMMQDIGSYTLRDVMLPRSHHSGMYTLRKSEGLGSGANTITQDYSVYDQLKVGGVRVLDCRPVVESNGGIYEAHGTKISGVYHGALGVSHTSMIAQINQFNDDYPGELIIIDVNGQETLDGTKFNRLGAAGFATIVESFKRLKHRAVLVAGEDMSKVALDRILCDGQSAVVVRMEEYNIRDVESWPGAAEGFITAVELPYRKHWSDERNANRMAQDQIDTLKREREDGNASAVYITEFILTQQGLDLISGSRVTDLNRDTWVLLVAALWPNFRGQYYPNWLAMDAIRGSELRGIAMTVNQCFVAKRCDTLNGRVPDAPAVALSEASPGESAFDVVDNTPQADS